MPFRIGGVDICLVVEQRLQNHNASVFVRGKRQGIKPEIVFNIDFEAVFKQRVDNAGAFVECCRKHQRRVAFMIFFDKIGTVIDEHFDNFGGRVVDGGDKKRFITRGAVRLHVGAVFHQQAQGIEVGRVGNDIQKHGFAVVQAHIEVGGLCYPGFHFFRRKVHAFTNFRQKVSSGNGCGGT